MSKLQKSFAVAAMTGVLAATAVVGFAGPASADTAGHYTYTCQPAGDGNVYTWSASRVKKCTGWVDAYINGKHVAHVHEGPLMKDGVGCLIALGGAGASTVSIIGSGGTNVAGWIGAGFSAVSIGLSCRTK